MNRQACRIVAVLALAATAGLGVAHAGNAIRTIGPVAEAPTRVAATQEVVIVMPPETCASGTPQVQTLRSVSATGTTMLARRTVCRAPAVAAAKPVARRTGKARPFPEDNPETRRCVKEAAKAFGVQTLPIYLILEVEGGKVGEVSHNTNGTVDIGPMQVNSWWLAQLKKRGVPVRYEDLLNNRCVNIAVGTYIYADALKSEKTMVGAIARYHSPKEKFQRRYLKKIRLALQRRVQDSPSTKATVAAAP